MMRKRNCLSHVRWLSIFLVWLVWHPGYGSTLDLDVLLDKVQDRYDRTRALTADFLQTATLTSIDRQQISAGRLYIEKPYNIRWEYNQPDVQTILYDGKTLRIYTPRRRQMLQSTIEEEERSNVALLFLAGVGKLRETFTISPLPNQGTEARFVRLLPRSTQAGFTELHLVVNPESYLIEKLTIYDTIGNLTEIRLTALEIHADLPPQTFELVLPPNTEILSPTDLTGRR